MNLFGDVVKVSKEYDGIRQCMINKAILAVPSYGCSHYFNNGGCAMCGFNKVIKKFRFREFHSIAIMLLIKIFITNLEKLLKEEFIKIDLLAVFMAGSFLNEEELPIDAQEIIINFFCFSNIGEIEIETRAEYVIKNSRRLSNYIKMAKEKKIRVAIGLESSDDEIRNVQIRKNLSKKEYETAVNMIRRMGGNVNTYVLIGSPFLQEEEVITKTIESVKYAWNSGSNLVSLEAYCVQEGTRWKILYEKKQIKPPTLWNIIEIIEKINFFSPHWQLGEFFDWPQPLFVPRNCSKCTERIANVLVYLRASHDFTCLEQIQNCSCNRR